MHRTLCTTHYVVHMMPIEDGLYSNLRMELRRGSLVLAVLAALKSERYGYTLRKVLADAGLEIEEGALYPMLRRLEAQGLLTSEWREEDRRNKRFYRLSSDGAVLLSELTTEWRAINGALKKLI
jgi:PadR family transcriptional regulator PadR